MRFTCLIAVCSVVLTAAARAVGLHPDRGVSMIWYGSQNNLDDRDGIVANGQIFYMWRWFEPAEGAYAFDDLDAKLKAVHGKNMKATIQINGNVHPDYLFDLVPYLKGKEYPSQHDHDNGYGPPMYWHAVYKEKYESLIRALAEHLKDSPYRETVLGIRQSYNAIGTEHHWIRPEDRTQDNWTRESGATWGGPWPWTREIDEQYLTWAIDRYVEHFDPPSGIPVFMRASALKEGGAASERHRAMATSGELMIFHTSSEPQPRGGKEAQYRVFLDYCKTGKTRGFMESWSLAKTSSSGWDWTRTSQPITRHQFNYWTLLVDLHCGASFPAMRPEDIDRAGCRADYEFAAQYAGAHHEPAVSPGAWIAFREGDYLVGDYTFLMQRRGPDESVPLYNVDDTRYGLWARRLPAGSNMQVVMDSTFAASLENNTDVTIRIWYSDSNTGSLVTTAFGREFVDRKADAGTWKQAEHTVDVSRADRRISITAKDGDCVLHMIEVLRGEPGTTHTRATHLVTKTVPNEKQSVYRYDVTGRRIHAGRSRGSGILVIRGEDNRIRILAAPARR